MRIAYFDCFSGVAGNMIIGALLDLGVSLESLHESLASLHLGKFRLRQRPLVKGSVAAVYVEVAAENVPPERHLADIQALIAHSALSTRVQEQATAVFERLAEAEAKVHGVPVEAVHFHEVGALDAIVDVVATCLGLEMLGVERVECSPLPLGRGFVQCQHGVLPLPAPATLELLQGVPCYGIETDRELVTPTGAALVTELAEHFGSLPAMTVEKVGWGAGKADLPWPNHLRIVLGQAEAPAPCYLREQVVQLETNLDDMNPEFYDYVMERLLSAGALDVFLTPVHMKKNRPGVILAVLCDEEHIEPLLDILFAETTTLGVRIRELERRCLHRESVTVETPYGPIRVKVARRDEQVLHAAPEYEDCKRAAIRHGIPIALVYEEANRQWAIVSADEPK